MSTSSPILTITPLKYPDIPPESTIIAEGRALIDSSTSWKRGKTYYKNVVTYSGPKRPGDEAPWYCRVSIHTPEEATFDQLWDKLGRNKASNEQQFISILNKVTQVKVLSESAEIWTMHYTFPAPLSTRVFTVLQVTQLDDQSSPRSGLIISIPVDLSGQDDLSKLEEKGVRGRYACVERFVELENGNTEWRMASSGSSGGFVPSLLTNGMMSSSIAKDVPHFFNWFRGLPK